MKAEQFMRLPEIFREIINVDTRLSRSVVQMDDLRERRKLRKAAASQYGYRLAGDGDARNA